MAYSVDWIAKRVTVPLSDLTFVSGTNYTLDVGDVHDELRRLEWAFADGLWAPQIADFGFTKILSGISYSATLEFINGYTWDINASNIVVSLLGINSNLLDTFVPANGVSVLANNSAGKIEVATGVVTQQDKDDIENQVHTHIMENGETFEEGFRLVRADAAGSIVKTGTEHKLKSADGGKDRIIANADEDGRTVTSTDSS